MTNPGVLAVGSALVDLLAPIGEDFLLTIDGEKGGMNMVDPAWLDETVARLPIPPVLVPGGAAGNTLFAMARLGNRASMLGKIGRDATGEFFRKALLECGASDNCLICGSGQPTGRCLSLITPDSERTMRSELGAAATLRAEDVAKADFSAHRLVYIEGYILFQGEVFETAISMAKEADCEVAIDLASFEVVRLFRDRIEQALGDVDIVFANEDESTAMWGNIPLEEQLARFADRCATAALKIGAEGSMIASGGQVFRVPARRVRPVDTTAAGDLWAAGYLHGYLAGLSPDKCGTFASAVAAEVVQVMGSALPEDTWRRLRSEFDGLKKG